MLKDLEKRNTDAGESSTGPVVIAQSNDKSSMMLVTILVSVLVTLALVSAVWFYQENKLLKQQQPATANDVHQQNQQAQQLVNAFEKIAQQSKAIKEAATEEQHFSAKPAETTQVQVAMQEKESNGEKLTPNALANQQKTDLVTEEAQGNTDVASSKKVVRENNPAIESNTVSQSTNEKPQLKSLSSLSIARKQLSPSELAEQKLANAEKALMDKEGEKAEQLLQDVLLLKPDHIEARKKLAAIWYAQKSYNPTINLLNQGIDQLPQEPDFRLMKAKILLQQNFPEQALSSLEPLAHIQSVDYQALLATAGQAANKHLIVIGAYQQLVLLQPNKGKWHLGLAVAYDRNSQFSEAVSAYQNALNVGDLSAQSQQFAEQRILALGD